MKKKKNSYLFYAVLFFIALFFFFIEQIESERMLGRITDVKSQIQSEIDRQASLKITLSQLESPKHLDAMAKKMNFIVPLKDNIIYLNETN